MMPAGTLAAMGTEVVMSGDFDADELSPLVKIKAAVSRTADGAPDVATVIEWMTINVPWGISCADMVVPPTRHWI